jgi:hypothetical protein
MNKLELIETLRNHAELTKSEAKHSSYGLT